MRFEVAPLPLDVVVCFFLWTGIVPSLWEFVWNVSRNGICLYYYLVYPSLGRLYFTHNSGWHQVQEDIAKIFEYPRLEINASPDGQMLHLLINGKSYKISELGSGLTQFFLVLASAVIRSSTPSYILIDEPEINLHPSLQLDFLTRLTAYANHWILFAMHSVGLARASADHIYSVRRSPDGQSEITDYNSTPRLEAVCKGVRRPMKGPDEGIGKEACRVVK